MPPSVRDGLAAVRDNIGISRSNGSLRSIGPLHSSISGSLQEGEDIELNELNEPILEATTALSDGYVSPRSLEYLQQGGAFSDAPVGFGAEGTDTMRPPPDVDDKEDDPDVELGALTPDATLKGATKRRGCCGGVCAFILAHWSKAALLAVVITVIVLFSVRGPRIFGELLRFFERWNNWGGWGIFIGLYIVNTTLFLPGVGLSLGAGFVFGFWKGLLAVWAGGAIGQAGAFLLARYLVRDLVVGYVAKKWSKWDLVEDMLEQEGWKMVLLLRLTPIVPWNLLNITMATTAIPFWQFTIASAVGIGFECSVLCYAGSLAQNIRDIVSGDAKPHGPIVYVIAGVSIFTGILAATFATVSVRRALKRAGAFRQAQQEGGADEDGGGAGGSESLAFLPQALPHEGPGQRSADISGRLSGTDLYASSDDDGSPGAPRRPVAAPLAADSDFGSDDSGGVRMLPLPQRSADRSPEGDDRSPAGLSPAGSGDDGEDLGVRWRERGAALMGEDDVRAGHGSSYKGGVELQHDPLHSREWAGGTSGSDGGGDALPSQRPAMLSEEMRPLQRMVI